MLILKALIKKPFLNTFITNHLCCSTTLVWVRSLQTAATGPNLGCHLFLCSLRPNSFYFLKMVSWSLRAAIMKCHRLGWFINSRNLFLIVLEDGGSGSGCQHGQVRDISAKSHSILMWWKVRRRSLL